jgi:hypothetical protein
MNINVYLEDPLGKALNKYAKIEGKTRNNIIREAVKEWVVHHHSKEWPNTVLKFQGVKDAPAFEATRDELLPPDEKPLK